MTRGERPPILDIYARVSRLGDDRQRPMEGQVDDCVARIAERAADVGEVHDKDRGRSAWDPKAKRPSWDRLMARLEAGLTDGVIVFDLARFSRRPIEGERLITAAENGLIVLDSEGEYDLTSASGKKAFRDQLASAAYESDRLSTRVRRGKRVKAMRGEPNHSWRPFGFEKDGVTIREIEAAVIREMAERVLSGESQDKLVIELNKRGVATSTGRTWSRESLRQMLMRPRNAGLVTYGGAVVGKLPGEPVLKSEVWERLSALFASRRRGRPFSEAYVCSGMVYCGRCGHKLTGRVRRHLKPYADGEPRRQYWCQPRAVDGGCGGISVDQRELDRHVGALVARILADPRHAEAVERAARAVADRRDVLDAELSECEHLAEELSGRLGRREITLARYDAAVAPLDRRIADLQAELEALDATPAADIDSETVAASRAQWEARWEVATTTERRTLLRRALRGRRLVVKPHDKDKPRRFDPERIVIADE